MEPIYIDPFMVFVAAALNLVVGFFWYSKWLFGPICCALSHVKKQPGKMALFYQAIVALVIAFFLSFFEAYIGITTVSDGMFIGFCFWLGFVATTQITPVIWSKVPFKLFVIDTSCSLLTFLVMGGVIGA